MGWEMDDGDTNGILRLLDSTLGNVHGQRGMGELVSSSWIGCGYWRSRQGYRTASQPSTS